jgi:hypothetical protein
MLFHTFHEDIIISTRRSEQHFEIIVSGMGNENTIYQKRLGAIRVQARSMKVKYDTILAQIAEQDMVLREDLNKLSLYARKWGMGMRSIQTMMQIKIKHALHQVSQEAYRWQPIPSQRAPVYVRGRFSVG